MAGGLAQPGFIDVQNGDRVALVCQPQGMDPAQSAGAACDQCRFHRALLPCSFPGAYAGTASISNPFVRGALRSFLKVAVTK